MEECGICEDCIDVCMEEAITKKAYKVIIDPDKCDSCGECVDVCPVGAIITLYAFFSIASSIQTSIQSSHIPHSSISIIINVLHHDLIIFLK